MAVERLCADQVAPERLLDNDPRPPCALALAWRWAVQPGLAPARHDPRVGLGRSGQVEQAVARTRRDPRRHIELVEQRAQAPIALWIVEIGLVVTHPGGESLPHRRVD